MTLNTPKLDFINVFDANYPYTFTFTYNGEQSIRNRIIIKDNDTYEVVYDKMQDGLRLNHIIEANTLSNNKSYVVQVQVFDTYGNSSNLSELRIFSCYTTPDFYLKNVNDGDIISSANFETDISFIQAEGDSIKEFKYYLYDSNRSQIYVSSSFYSLENSSHIYYGLENMNNYYIRAVGGTVYGFNVDTGYIKVGIKYECIPTNVAFEAINNDGKIILTSNIILTDYDLDNDNYALENGELTLKDNTITYHILDSILNFSLVIKARQLPLDSPFVNINCKNGNISLSLHKISDKYYCKLNVSNGDKKYLIYENILGQVLGSSNGEVFINTANEAIRTLKSDYDSSILMIIEVHRKNHIYSLECYYQ